jgi:anti-sigma factor (TIGR02949 family)
MECPEIRRCLWEYLDQELGAEEAASVQAHLIDCGHCRPAYCCDRALLALLGRCAAAQPGAPPGLERAIRVRLTW